MKCPLCNHHDSKVVETRESSDSMRRRRECLGCNERFTTYERVDRDLVVIKKDGRKEKFSNDKITKGVTLACEKRPVTKEQITSMITRIVQVLRENCKEVDSKVIGEQIMRELAKLDEVAYIRFASVYRDFTDKESFAQEIDRLNERKVDEKEEIVRCRL